MIVIKNDFRLEVTQFLKECAEKAIKNHEGFILGISGGSMASFLGGLGDEFADFSKWHIFLVDERAVRLTDGDSNYKAIRSAWPASLKANFYPIDESKLQNLNELAADYESHIKEVFKRFNVDKFDCLLLGLGPDGHTASLFPGHLDFLNNLNCMNLVIPVTNSPKPPSNRISLSPKVIQSATNSAFIITNSASKASVIAAIIDKKDHNSPPTIVASNAHWFLDEISASHLNN